MTTTFNDLGVPDRLATALARTGIDTPFAIQVQALPAALDGRDLCGRAPTGSGKTLAFAIPIAARVGRGAPKRPRALILTPTRELAGQIQTTLRPLADAVDRRVASFYGGTNINRDIDRLRRGIDIAVATPGRLEDLIDRRVINLSDVDIVVVDEADRMADMGFLPVVRRLLDQTADDRQTMLFSATLDGDVDVLIRRYQHDPVRVEAELEAEHTGDVTHHFWPADRTNRQDLLVQVLRRSPSTIVFARTKRGADRLARQLAKKGIAAAAIHGDRSQNQRERALRDFAKGSVTALVATDVAARGIHVDDVSAVVHYDLPSSDKDYVHRSGRTGRAGANGIILSLVLPDQHDDLHAIQKGVGLPRGLDKPDVARLGDGDVVRTDTKNDVPSVRHDGDRPNGRRNPTRHRGGGGGTTSRRVGNRSATEASGNDARGGSRRAEPERVGDRATPRGGARNRARRQSHRR